MLDLMNQSRTVVKKFANLQIILKKGINQSMKILMFGWEFPPHISGGLGTACHGLTKAMSRLSADITFVLPRLDPGDSGVSHVRLMGANHVQAKSPRRRAKEFLEDMEIVEIETLLTPYLSHREYQTLTQKKKNEREQQGNREQAVKSILTTGLSGDYGADLISEIGRYGMLAGAVAAEQDFDIIHAHDWMTFPAGIEAKKTSGKPLIVHVHALETDRSGPNVNSAAYDIERRGMENADLVIAVSYYTKDMIVRHYGIPETKIRVVHNAVDREGRLNKLHVKRHLDEKVVLFLGRITFQKGPDYFVEAAKKVLDHIENVRFVMAGSGDMFPRMVERIAELRIGRHFHFTGFLRGVEVEKMYAMSDLYVMPSVSEPFGIAPLEAMVYDIPIIVSKQSGVAELLPRAIKVDFWDVEKLAEKIIMLLTQPEMTRQLVSEGSKQLEEIKWEKAAEKVIDVYREILQ